MCPQAVAGLRCSRGKPVRLRSHEGLLRVSHFGDAQGLPQTPASSPSLSPLRAHAPHSLVGYSWSSAPPGSSPPLGPPQMGGSHLPQSGFSHHRQDPHSRCAIWTIHCLRSAPLKEVSSLQKALYLNFSFILCLSFSTSPMVPGG